MALIGQNESGSLMRGWANSNRKETIGMQLIFNTMPMHGMFGN